jgi:hypothetical protein
MITDFHMITGILGSQNIDEKKNPDYWQRGDAWLAS